MAGASGGESERAAPGPEAGAEAGTEPGTEPETEPGAEAGAEERTESGPAAGPGAGAEAGGVPGGTGMEAPSPRQYIEAAGRSLIWLEDFQRAGDYFPVDVTDRVRDWYAASKGGGDVLVGFIPPDVSGDGTAAKIKASLEDLYRRHPRPLHCAIVLVDHPGGIPPAWEEAAAVAGPGGSGTSVITVTTRAGQAAVAAGRPPRSLPLAVLGRMTPPTEDEMSRAAARPAPPSAPGRAPRRTAGASSAVSYGIIGALAVFWIVMGMPGTAEPVRSLVAKGALVPFLVQSGEWWRIFTYMLIHAGPIHLLFNGFATYYLGPTAETLLGRGRFLAVFLLSGALAGLGRVAFGAPNVVSVGASGAVFGIIGSLAYLAWTDTPAVRQAMMRYIGTLLMINVLFWFMNRRTDMLVHGAGLVAGILVTAVLVPERSPALIRGLAAAAIAAFSAAVFLGLF